MQANVVQEKILNPVSGFLMLFVGIIGLIGSTLVFVFAILDLVAGTMLRGGWLLGLGILGWLLFSVLLGGLKIVNPNEARIFTLFGNYYGTIGKAGFFFVNPFCESYSPDLATAKAERNEKIKQAASEGKTIAPIVSAPKAVSLKKQAYDNGQQKVNDILGNPIVIGTIVIWQVDDPTQAVFSVENYREFLSIQADSVIRNVARLYPYDIIDDDDCDEDIQEKTLRGSAIEIADLMKVELQKRVQAAGLTIDEVRITHLAYAEEIAVAMLQRQQATAVIAAKRKIVDGAVGMVKMAIDKLGDEDVVVLDDERKAAMVSNLLVVLCGNRETQPIVNSGSIY